MTDKPIPLDEQSIEAMMSLARAAKNTVYLNWAAHTDGAVICSEMLGLIEQATFNALQRQRAALDTIPTQERGDEAPATAASAEQNVSLVLLRAGERVHVLYTNWRGETRERNIEFNGVAHWARTQWHPEPQWMINGTDIDSNEDRIWSVKDMVPIATLATAETPPPFAEGAQSEAETGAPMKSSADMIVGELSSTSEAPPTVSQPSAEDTARWLLRGTAYASVRVLLAIRANEVGGGSGDESANIIGKALDVARRDERAKVIEECARIADLRIIHGCDTLEDDTESEIQNWTATNIGDAIRSLALPAEGNK